MRKALRDNNRLLSQGKSTTIHSKTITGLRPAAVLHYPLQMRGGQ
ncbi:hypothetical protein [Sodalis endosymbiont of Henestaris halophilus]